MADRTIQCRSGSSPESRMMKPCGSIAAHAWSAATRIDGQSSVSRSWMYGSASWLFIEASAATAASLMFGSALSDVSAARIAAAASGVPIRPSASTRLYEIAVSPAE